MSFSQIEFPGFTVSAPSEFEDITDSLESNDMPPPFTVANPTSGVGALQFSPALYRSGIVPNPKIDELHSMISEFGESRSLGAPIEEWEFEANVFGSGATFRADGEFVVVWYISDGRNILLVTYVCDWGDRDEEFDIVNAIVESIRFSLGNN